MSKEKDRGTLPGLGGGPSVPPPNPRPQPTPSTRAVRRVMRSLPNALRADAPAGVRQFASELSQIQRASERLAKGISVTGPALPVRRRLADIPLDAPVERDREAAAAHREAMMNDLAEVIRYLHSHPHIPDHFAATLIRLRGGLARVHDGYRFYVFEPPASGKRYSIGDIAAVKRVGLAAAIDALMLCGDDNETACRTAAARVKADGDPADFDFPPGEEVNWSQLRDMREEVKRGRVKAMQQPVKWRGKDTTPHDLYQKTLMPEVRSEVALGPEAGREYAERLMRAVTTRL